MHATNYDAYAIHSSLDEFFASIISLLQWVLHLVYSIGKKYKAIWNID